MSRYKRVFDDGLYEIQITALERESADHTPNVLFGFKIRRDPPPPRRAEVPIAASKATVRRRLAKVGFVSDGKQISEVMDMMNDFLREAVEEGGFHKSRYEPIE